MNYLNNQNFNEEVIESDVPVMVDFFANWCAPCKMISPIMDQLATEFDGKFKICKLDVDTAGDIAGKYGVMSIPTVLIFKNGEVVDQFIGALPKVKIEEYIKKHLN